MEIIGLEHDLTTVTDKIKGLKIQIQDLEYEKYKFQDEKREIKEKIHKIKTTYTGSLIKSLIEIPANVYVPESFRMFLADDDDSLFWEIYPDENLSKDKCYVLTYNDYIFSIIDTPVYSKSNSFRIGYANKNNKVQAQTDHEKEVDDNFCPYAQSFNWDDEFIIKLFYNNPWRPSNPDDPNCSFMTYPKNFNIVLDGSVKNLDEVLTQAETIFNTEWSDKLSFGLFIFWHWIKLFYKKESNPKLEKLFEEKIEQ